MDAIGRLVTVSVMVLKRLDGEQINIGLVQGTCSSLDYCLVPAEGAAPLVLEVVVRNNVVFRKYLYVLM
jgi:hypothetical protein